MDLLETKLKKIFQSCELIIGLTVITNIVIFYISYQFFVREDQKLIQNLLTSQSKVIKELAIYDISKFFSEQNVENDYRYIENSLDEKCDLNNFQVKTTYNSLQTKINDKCRIIDLSKIRETLNQLYTKDYIYNIRLNDILLFNNKIQDNFVMFKDEVILNDLYKILLLWPKNIEVY